jgi:hypothetical protein
MITLSEAFKRVNHAIKQTARSSSAGALRLKMIWRPPTSKKA